jgi:hypothetical protein
MTTIDRRLEKLLQKRDKERIRNDTLRKQAKRVVIDGRAMSLWEAAREFGTTAVYASRIKRGWPPEAAVTRPSTWQHYKRPLPLNA